MNIWLVNYFWALYQCTLFLHFSFFSIWCRTHSVGILLFLFFHHHFIITCDKPFYKIRDIFNISYLFFLHRNDIFFKIYITLNIHIFTDLLTIYSPSYIKQAFVSIILTNVSYSFSQSKDRYAVSFLLTRCFLTSKWWRILPRRKPQHWQMWTLRLIWTYPCTVCWDTIRCCCSKGRESLSNYRQLCFQRRCAGAHRLKRTISTAIRADRCYSKMYRDRRSTFTSIFQG